MGWPFLLVSQCKHFKADSIFIIILVPLYLKSWYFVIYPDKKASTSEDQERPLQTAVEKTKRTKRFVNLFQIIGSLYNEGLDRPRIPYVYAPSLNRLYEDEGVDDDDWTRLF